MTGMVIFYILNNTGMC